MTRRIAVLGSTGSVGTNALKLIAERPTMFEAVVLSAHRSTQALGDQARATGAATICLVDESVDPPIVPTGATLFRGADGVLEALGAARPDLVLNAITGAAGLPASEWALRRGVPLALANKESLVMAGAYLRELAAETNTPILPVDSEHCAIHQCLRGERRDRVRRIFLTASGGPFRERPPGTFATITRAEALDHPTWDMGPRITVGSATMMNKVFEVVEAHWLFGLAPDQIEVLVHPQSVVHSMVEFVDGSILAQLGVPDMRVPILYCLAHPDRTPFESFEPFDPLKFQNLQFTPVDHERFPAVSLAYTTIQRGGDSGAVLNAADEVMTERFLAGQADFPSITETVSEVLHSHPPREIHKLADVFEADRRARETAGSMHKRSTTP